MKKIYLILMCLWMSPDFIQAASGSVENSDPCTVTVTASTIGASGTICLGDSVQLKASASRGTAPYTYLWTPGGGLSNPAIFDPMATPTVTTTYTVNVTDHNGCTGSASVTITVNQPPVVNPDTLLLQYITGQPLTATGGVSPYTYNFSPSVNTNSLLSLPDTNTTFTITVTGANGCSSHYFAQFVPLSVTTGECSSVYMSEYIQDTAGNNDAIELYNPTIHPISLNNYYLLGTTNGSLLSPPFIIQLHGIICPHRMFLVANSHAGSTLLARANMLSDSLNFNGKDIVALAKAVVSPPNVNFSFLDEVGAISPLPTDSGWVVGLGSTKNHTLVRRSNVEQGDLNWATAQYEWNVHPQGTFTYIGRYRSACTLGAPDLTLAFANGQTTCESGSHYYEFDVMVSADQPSWLDNCVMYVPYNPLAFGNNIVANSNVTVTAYPNFSSPMTYYNPQGFIYDISPDTLGLPFGMDTGIGSWSRTQINITPQPMLHVKIRVQNCSEPVGISFTDTSLAQIFSWYTLNQGDSEIDAMSYNYTYFTGGLNDNTCQMAISDFNAPITAGVDSILTITGSGFGTTQGTGQVKFYDADTSNYRIQRLNTSDYLSWNNTQIKIRLPAFADSVLTGSHIKDPLTVGGGNFIVKNSCGDSVVSNANANGDPFSVYYNINQIWNQYYTPSVKKEILLRSTDTNGGYVLRFDSVTFPKGSIQRLIFARAMRDWTCYTGMNWTVGKDTNYTFSGSYTGVNYVFFSPSVLDSGTVAKTFIQPDECHDSINIVLGAITCFNSTKGFIYDTTGAVSIPSGHFDFYGVCLHELGHFIELGHSTDPSSLMYWTANEGPISASNRITLGTPAAAAAVDGGIYSVNNSVSIPDICDNFSAMQGENTSCINETSISSMQKPHVDFSIYPNPSHGIFTIQTSINNYTLVIMNMLGQRVLSRKIQDEKSLVDISTLPNGMYFVQEQYTNGIATQKLIINK